MASNYQYHDASHFGPSKCWACKQVRETYAYVTALRLSRSGNLCSFVAFSGCEECAKKFLERKRK